MARSKWELFNSYASDDNGQLLRVDDPVVGTRYGYLREIGEDFYSFSKACKKANGEIVVDKPENIDHDGKAPNFAQISEDQLPKCESPKTFVVGFF